MLRLALIIILCLPCFAESSDPAQSYYTTNGGDPIVQHFTIFQRQQVIPKYLTVTDGTGAMEYINPGPTPDYPATFGVKICFSNPFNLYSAANSERLEVWQDTAGTATVEDVLTVCPQFTR